MQSRRYLLPLLLFLPSLMIPIAFAGEQPNILLIVADDLGYADLGAYGGEIKTPNIDALASEGLIFTQFHTAASCAPTRAMLLSGNNNHVAGMASQFGNRAITKGITGYERYLSDRVAVIPKVLKAGGYRTYMAGKWHLGGHDEEAHTPAHHGFDRSYNLSYGAGNHYDEVGFFEGGSHYYENGKRVSYPKGQYSTAVYTDKLISYLEADEDSPKPFFIFAAYTSPHWPLQVPENEIANYKGQYDIGYDQLRAENFESLKTAEIIPSSSKFPPRNKAVVPWSSLSAESKKRESKKMELYAAMLDNLDRHVGRLINYLKENNLYDNTLIVFMSDNGAAAEDFYNKGPFTSYLQTNYDNSFKNMGFADSFVSYGPQWAEAGSAPFRLHKEYATEGGTTAPMIMSGAFVKRVDEINRAFVSVSDLAPTFYELAGVTYPEGFAEMTGKSILPILAGQSESVRNKDDVTVFYQSDSAGLWQGHWKLVNVYHPFDERHFELFNLEEDPGETIDLSKSHADKREQLVAIWRIERQKLGIILPEDL